VDVLADSIQGLIAQGWNVVVGGSGDEAVAQKMREAANQNPECVAFHDGYADANAIFAGSDVMIMPSRFEPCGLMQMEAMRYGCIPIATDTGGLHDTIEDGKTGFLIPHPPTVEGILEAAQRAMDTYKKPEQWQEMQKAAMRVDNSWEHAAKGNLAIYDQVVSDKQREISGQSRA
jgi:starch synthase